MPNSARNCTPDSRAASGPQYTPPAYPSGAGPWLRRAGTLLIAVLLTGALLAILGELVHRHSAPSGAFTDPLQVEFGTRPARTVNDVGAAPASPPDRGFSRPAPAEPVPVPSPAPEARKVLGTNPAPGPPELTRSAPPPATAVVSPPAAQGDSPASDFPAETPTANPGNRARTAGIDRDYQVLERIRPEYPRGARRRGTEGHVVLEFTVTTGGRTADIVVIDASPPGVFDGSAIAAVREFRFAPRIRSGEPVEARGVRNRFSFRLRE